MTKLLPPSPRQLPNLYNLSKLLQIVWQKPKQIIMENPVTGFVALFATVAPSIAPKAISIIGIISVILMIIGILLESRKYQIYTKKSLPIPIVINIDNPHSEYDALNSLFNLIANQDPIYSNYAADVSKYLNITASDLVYKYNGNIFEQPRLISFLQITKKLIEKVKQKTPQDSQIYLVYMGPISVAWLVGAMLQREGMIIFQRDQNGNCYQPVMNVQDRQLKEKIDHLSKFTKTQQNIQFPRSEKLTLAINSASHKINYQNPEIANYGDLIVLENTNSHAIDFQEAWLDYVREIFHVLNEEQQNYQEIKLVYSIPVSLAIAAGMAIGDYWNIVLTNFDRDSQTYADVIKMNQVKYYI